MGNLTERQNEQVTNLKESIVLDKEFQNYIDMCDKILSRDAEENRNNENTVGVPPPATPGAQVPNRAPQAPQAPQAQQGNTNNANVMNTLKQMKDKMKRGQDVRDDLNNLLNTIQ